MPPNTKRQKRNRVEGGEVTPDEISGAKFSPCKKYRYLLWRRWDIRNGRLLCILLNPSTAGERVNDPTVTRCINRAVKMGFGALEVVNLFALRSTDPAALTKEADPVGPENNEAIRAAVKRARMILCGWGSYGNHQNRACDVLQLIAEEKETPHALGLNLDGTPIHPLYVSYDVQPQAMK